MRKTLIITAVAVLLGGSGLWCLQAASLRGRPITTGTATSSTMFLQATTTPTVAAPTLTPNLITVNTPSQVTATVFIPETTVTGVNLLRLNTNGSSTIVASMLDNGQSGDQTAGDKIFTARFSLNETQSGEVKVQVSAAFRGILRRSLSPIAPIQIWNLETTGMGLTVPFPNGWRVTPIHRNDPTGVRGVEISTPTEAEYQSSGITIAIERNTSVAAFTSYLNGGSNTFLYNLNGWALYSYRNSSSGADFLVAIVQRGPDVVRIAGTYSQHSVSIIQGLISNMN